MAARIAISSAFTLGALLCGLNPGRHAQRARIGQRATADSSSSASAASGRGKKRSAPEKDENPKPATAVCRRPAGSNMAISVQTLGVAACSMARVEERARARIHELAKQAGVVASANPLKAKIDRNSAAAWLKNQEQGLRGQLDCRRIRRAKADPVCDGFVGVGVSKQRGKLGQAFSPFFLAVPEGMQAFATETGTPEGRLLPARPLELVWQSAKVMKSEIDEDGLATDAFFKRRARIYDRGVVQRRYFPAEYIGGSLLCWRYAPPVDYISSRKFYCTAYCRSAAALPEYQFLQTLHEDGFNLLLLGPDGHPLFEDVHVKGGTVDEFSAQEAIERAYRDTSKPFGHERSLLAMLLGIHPWKGAIDPTGILDLCTD